MISNLGKNTLANLITKVWNMTSIYLFIPLYIKILGETAYGLVSFFATMQAAINVLGLGLSNTLRREFALGEEDFENKQRKYKLLRTIETIYFIIEILVILLCFMSSGLVAEKWLNIGNMNIKVVSHVISLMGFSIAIQMTANLYAGCLFGLNHQIVVNLCSVLWSALKSIGSLLIIGLVKPDLQLFYLWHIITDIAYVIILRAVLVRKLQIQFKAKWSFDDLKNLKVIWRYAVGILIISFIALINKQLDKIIISKFLSLVELGAYNLATTLGGMGTIFAIAMYASVFPTFTKNISTHNLKDAGRDFIKINRTTNIVTACMGSFIAIYSIPLIDFWTQSNTYTNILHKVAPLVVLAVMITEFQEIPYAFALANGTTRINVIVGLSFIPLIAVSTWYSVVQFGLLGVGTSYLIIMSLQTLIYEYLVYSKFLKYSPTKLIIRDTLLPVGLSMLMALVSRNMAERMHLNDIKIIIFAMISGAIALFINFFLLARKNEKLEIKGGEK